MTKGYRKVLEERERLKKELEAEDQKNQNEQEKQKKDDFYLNSAKFVENIVNKEEAPVRIIETEYNIAENKKIETEKWEKKFGLPALKEFSEKKDNLTTGRRNTNSDISAAKQRYLERKKAYEAQTTD